LSCSESEAEDLAHTHCNILSLWLGCFVGGVTDLTYDLYFRELLNKKLCKENGYLLYNKDVVYDKMFDIQRDLDYLEDYENVLNPDLMLDSDCFYQAKIKSSSGGSHYIITYVDDETGELMGADTSYRGTPFVFKNKVSQSQFKWLLEI